MSSQTTPHAAIQRPRMRLLHGEPVQIANGTLEGLKWLALLLMTLDHVNKYVFAWGLPGAVEAGRLVMPIFGFVLAYNLARANLGELGFSRVATRLLTYGVLATPVYIGLNTALMHQLHPSTSEAISWGPLNILFTLLLATVIIALIEKRKQAWLVIAAVCFALAAPMVEYAWFGLAFVLASWFHCRRGSIFSAVLLFLATLGLTAVNGNVYALLALAPLLLTTRVDLRVPRWRHVFYLYYPLHLLAIWIWLYGTGIVTKHLVG